MEPTGGRILIDDLDTGKIGLTDLRSRLTIIPREFLLFERIDLIYSIAEDPTVLSGTLRSTLDVFGEYDDAEIVSPQCKCRIPF